MYGFERTKYLGAGGLDDIHLRFNPESSPKCLTYIGILVVARLICSHPFPDKTFTPSAMAGVFDAAGNAFSSCIEPMTLDTQMTLALLQELLLSLRANDPDGFKGWLAEGVHELGEPAVIELMLDGLNPILTTNEGDRLVGWHLGVSM